MIAVAEAKKAILDHCPEANISEVSLNEAGGFVLAEHQYAPIDSPHFDQSAMDGYAFSFDTWDGKSDLLLAGEVQTGTHFPDPLKPLTAIRIFTGAALPAGADTVVIQENVRKDNNRISITDEKLVRGSNVRLQGSQTKKGTLALGKGHLLTPASISFLAGIGINKVRVYSNPSIRIITTGKELMRPGEKLKEGKVYESNSFALKAVLCQMNIPPVSITLVDDQEEEIVRAIQNQLSSDILILTGGVSVGDYDFVAASLEQCDVKKIFHGVKQKPGKPFYFGVHGQTLVFGLPGNPASALTCFYEYVSEAISALTKKEYFRKIKLPLSHDYSKKNGMTFFLKGKMTPHAVSVLNDQESYKMDSFAMANSVIELDADKENFLEGDLVNVRIIT